MLSQLVKIHTSWEDTENEMHEGKKLDEMKVFANEARKIWKLMLIKLERNESNMLK